MIVKCDMCGRLCSHSYLRTHRRLAHKIQSAPPENEPETIEAILSLYDQLSETGQKMVREGVQALAVRMVERH